MRTHTYILPDDFPRGGETPSLREFPAEKFLYIVSSPRDCVGIKFDRKENEIIRPLFSGQVFDTRGVDKVIVYLYPPKVDDVFGTDFDTIFPYTAHILETMGKAEFITTNDIVSKTEMFHTNAQPVSQHYSFSCYLGSPLILNNIGNFITPGGLTFPMPMSPRMLGMLYIPHQTVDFYLRIVPVPLCEILGNCSGMSLAESFSHCRRVYPPTVYIMTGIGNNFPYGFFHMSEEVITKTIVGSGFLTPLFPYGSSPRYSLPNYGHEGNAIDTFKKWTIDREFFPVSLEVDKPDHEGALPEYPLTAVAGGQLRNTNYWKVPVWLQCMQPMTVIFDSAAAAAKVIDATPPKYNACKLPDKMIKYLLKGKSDIAYDEDRYYAVSFDSYIDYFGWSASRTH